MSVTVAEGVTCTVVVGGTRVICCVALVPSVAVAVTVTVCRVTTGIGARYVMVVRPVASGPTGGLICAPATLGLKSKEKWEKPTWAFKPVS